MNTKKLISTLFLTTFAVSISRAQPFPNDRDGISIYCLEVYNALDDIFSGSVQHHFTLPGREGEFISSIKQIAVLKDRVLGYLTRRTQFLTEEEYRNFSPLKESIVIVARRDVHQFLSDTADCLKARQKQGRANIACKNSEAKAMINRCRDPQFVQALIGE